jgi:hypothetical protein
VTAAFQTMSPKQPSTGPYVFAWPPPGRATPSENAGLRGEVTIASFRSGERMPNQLPDADESFPVVTSTLFALQPQRP